MQEPFSTTDKHDKNNPSIQFIPPIDYTQEMIDAGNKLVEIINNPDLPESDKKTLVWNVLNNINP